MALSEQDFTKGVDFTGLPTVTAEDLNNLLDLAAPVSDNLNAEGKGLVLVTTDLTLDVPEVPTALIVNKWHRYLWCRKPFDDTGVIKLYGWNNNLLAPDTTFSYWVQLFPDIAEFETAISDVEVIADTALQTANNAISIAAAASSLASTANTNANSALAQTTATLDIANQANTAAQEALNTAAELEDEIAAAVTASSAKKDVNAALIPGLIPLQLIRTNATNSAVEWFNVKDTYIKLSETTAINVSAGNASTGTNLRDLNTEDYNTQATVLSTPADSMFTLPIGTYHCNISVPGDATSNKHQAFLTTAADVVVIVGSTASMGSASQVHAVSEIKGVFTIAVATKFKVVDYWVGNETDGLGEAANVAPIGGEVYTIAEFWRIG